MMPFQGGMQGDRTRALAVKHTWDQNPILSLTDQVTLGRNVLFASPSLTCEMGVTALSWGCGKDLELQNVNKVPGPWPALSKWKPLSGFSLQLTGTSKCLCTQAPSMCSGLPKCRCHWHPGFPDITSWKAYWD